METKNESQQESSKYGDIREYFEKLFARKDASTNKTITRNAWFLKDDTQFQEMTGPNPITPGGPEMHMYAILRKLNKNNDDLRKINIEIPTFIDAVVNILLNSNGTLQRINKSIDTWHITENYSCLPEAINLLNAKVSEKVLSNLSVSVAKIKHFPAGDYYFSLDYSSRSPSNPALERKNQAYINKYISIPHDRSIIHLKAQDDSNTFHSIEFSALDVSNDSSLVDNELYSGATLSEFWITVNLNGEVFGNSPSQPFFRSLLSKVSELRTISNDSLTTQVEVPIIDEKNKQKFEDNVPWVILQLSYDFDPLTRASILSKIYRLFETIIEKRAEMQNIINEILDRYFPDISEQVKAILNQAGEEGKREGCDCSCIVV